MRIVPEATGIICKVSKYGYCNVVNMYYALERRRLKVNS